jgi:hypothetical protein
VLPSPSSVTRAVWTTLPFAATAGVCVKACDASSCSSPSSAPPANALDASENEPSSAAYTGFA